MILFKVFLSQFYDSAIVPDIEVQLENPSADAISDNKIEMEVEEERTEPEEDVLAHYNK